MAHRSPARWLAPLALLTCALAVLAVVATGSGGAGSEKTGSTTSKTATTGASSTTRTTATTTPTRRTTTPRTYTVKRGDTPSGIADTLGVTVQELLAANPGVDAQTLRVGQRLELPR